MRAVSFLVLVLLLGAQPALAQVGIGGGGGAVYNASPPTLTDGQPWNLRLDVNGNLMIGFGQCLSGESACIGTDSTSYIRMQPYGVAIGGSDSLSYISVGVTEDEHTVKATAGTLYSVTATNVNAAVRYLKCGNATIANNIPGTTTPIFRIAIPGATTGAGFTTSFPVGFAFSTALTCWTVTGAADNDVAEVAANEIMVFYTFK